MKARTQLEQCCDVAIDRNLAPIGTVDAGEAFEHGAFARTVGSDNTESGSVVYLKGNIVERPEFFILCAPTTQDGGLDVAITFVVKPKVFGNRVDDYGGF